MRPPILASVLALLSLLVSAAPAARPAPGTRTSTKPSHAPPAPSGGAPSVVIQSQNAGPTPFISELRLLASDLNALRSITFTVMPRAGSVTRPISATYTLDYLQAAGFVNNASGQITLRVFGLYANTTNKVNLTYCFTDDSTQNDSAMVPTGPYVDTCGYSSMTKTQARTSDTTLSYDYMLLKAYCGNTGVQSPVIMDTDGAVRWVGTAGVKSFTSLLYANGIYISAPPTPTSDDFTGLWRMEFDGRYAFVKDYANLGVTTHHNLDPGRDGMLLEINNASQIESVILEIDPAGNVLKTFDFAQIISAAMTAGGENPSGLVKPRINQRQIDWFHNNACWYRASDNTLIASARELFVIAVDYDTKQIKWILGDTTKHWYVNFQSLRPYTLNAPGNVPPNTLAPIGQHTVSVTHDDKLLLFDNGVNSLTASNNPPGLSRTYSAPRKYDINLQTKRATEMWNYESGQTLNSPFCSSVYEDGPLSYLIDYSFVDNLSPGGNPLYCVLIGLNPAGAKVFDYRHTTNGCDFAWNAMPVHLEHLVFAGAATNAVKIASIAKGAVSCTVNFAAIAGGHYRLEYKNNLSDASWSPLTDYIAECTSSASITDLTIGSQTQRFYRVVRLSS